MIGGWANVDSLRKFVDFLIHIFVINNDTTGVGGLAAMVMTSEEKGGGLWITAVAERSPPAGGFVTKDFRLYQLLEFVDFVSHLCQTQSIREPIRAIGKKISGPGLSALPVCEKSPRERSNLPRGFPQQLDTIKCGSETLTPLVSHSGYNGQLVTESVDHNPARFLRLSEVASLPFAERPVGGARLCSLSVAVGATSDADRHRSEVRQVVHRLDGTTLFQVLALEKGVAGAKDQAVGGVTVFARLGRK
jgi:hypothetical protein